MNILQALDDPALFGQHYKGSTWKPWRAFAAALFAVPMDDEELALYRHHTGRQTPPSKPFKEAVLNTGRRTSKSRGLATIGVYLATVCAPEYLSRLAPGETPTVIIIAADKRQARNIFRYVRGLFASTAMLKPMVATEAAESLTLTNGVVIEVHAASYRSVRGYTVVAALCDEVAFWRDDTGANPDEEILNALRPSLATLDGLLLLASTPWAKRGAFYRSYRENWGRDDADVLVWRGTTLEMNPTYPRKQIERAYEEDPERAAAEFGAEFRSGLSDFVQRDVVDRCVIPGRVELPRLATGRHLAFVDLAGGGADSMVLAIAHKGTDVPVLDMLREVKGPCSPEAVVIEFAAMLKLYGLTEVVGDRYAAEWPVERFRAHGITYRSSEKTKAEIYLNALPLLNSGKVELLDSRILTAQLCSLERRTARGGRDSIDHPPGGHDDVANAAMGALLLAGGGGGFDTSYAWAG